MSTAPSEGRDLDGKKRAGGKHLRGVLAKPLKVLISGGWSKAEMHKPLHKPLHMLHREHKPLQCFISTNRARQKTTTTKIICFYPSNVLLIKLQTGRAQVDSILFLQEGEGGFSSWASIYSDSWIKIYET